MENFEFFCIEAFYINTDNNPREIIIEYEINATEKIIDNLVSLCSSFTGNSYPFNMFMVCDLKTHAALFSIHLDKQTEVALIAFKTNDLFVEHLQPKKNYQINLKKKTFSNFPNILSVVRKKSNNNLIPIKRFKSKKQKEIDELITMCGPNSFTSIRKQKINGTEFYMLNSILKYSRWAENSKKHRFLTNTKYEIICASSVTGIKIKPYNSYKKRISNNPIAYLLDFKV